MQPQVSSLPGDAEFLQREQRLVQDAAGRIAVQFLREFDSRWIYEAVCEQATHTIGSLQRSLRYWPELRGRQPAMSFAKVGTLVFGPQLPSGNGESIYLIESRKGKKQILRCLRDGRPEHRSEVGLRYRWHSDDNLAVFGRPVRGELVRVRNALKREGVWPAGNNSAIPRSSGAVN
jgi:hypothetical protein